jgi:hypothetical protein
MISPTDTAYPVLPASPSANELMDAYTPDVFELKFAEENTRQPAPRTTYALWRSPDQRRPQVLRICVNLFIAVPRGRTRLRRAFTPQIHRVLTTCLITGI